MEKLKLKGEEFTFQQWKQCANISKVKYSNNTNIKSSKTIIFHSLKHYSLLP